MELHAEWIDYDSDGEPVRAYSSRPAAGDELLPGVVVIQEVWGVDPHIRDVADRLAAAGYVALAPDLYSRGGTPPTLEAERIEEPPMPPERDWGRMVADLAAAVAHLREDPGCDGEVGAIGFCLGGGLSGRLAAAGAGLSAAVIFYGGSPPPESVTAISCPVLGIYGGEDHRITDGVPAFAEAMSDAGRYLEARIYPHAPHAFFNDTRPSYRVGPARDAWARTLGFLATHLSRVGVQTAL